MNIPATFITLIKNPSQKLLDFKKKVAPTYEDMHEILIAEIEKSTLH